VARGACGVPGEARRRVIQLSRHQDKSRVSSAACRRVSRVG
jgi:hypothetical protein